MNDQTTAPKLPTTVRVESAAIGPGTSAAARTAGQAPWARVGLLGMGVAAIIAASVLAFGMISSPTGTLAAGNGSTSDADVLELTGEARFPGGRMGPGFVFGGVTITAISGSNLSLETEDGWTRTITVDDGTSYRRGGEDISLGDLAVGDRIGFAQTREDDGTWTIDGIVVILPHVAGEVTAVDGATITVERRDGTTATINVANDTAIKVNGEDAQVTDVEVGMFVRAEGERAGDTAIDATRVFAGEKRGGWRRGDGPWLRAGPFHGDAGPNFTWGPVEDEPES